MNRKRNPTWTGLMDKHKYGGEYEKSDSRQKQKPIETSPKLPKTTPPRQTTLANPKISRRFPHFASPCYNLLLEFYLPVLKIQNGWLVLYYVLKKNYVGAALVILFNENICPKGGWRYVIFLNCGLNISRSFLWRYRR